MHAILSMAALAAPPVLRAQPQSADSVSPPHRRHHALTYDPVGKRVLLAGGQHLASSTNTPLLSDLWSWNGARWTQVSGNTGVAMITHKLFADSAHGIRAALVRGIVTHLQNGAWQVVVPDSQTRRESAAAAYDSHRGLLVCFGGLVGGRAYDTSGETWAFDGERWMRLAAEGPPPSLGGAMAYDARRQVMVLFGGLDTTGHKLADTWEWDGRSWTRVATGGPPARFGAGIAYDARRGEVILFGGVNAANEKLNDTWRWNGRRWEIAFAGPRAPPARSEGYLAYDAGRGVTVMFGGEGASVVPTMGDTWEWDGVIWQRRR